MRLAKFLYLLAGAGLLAWVLHDADLAAAAARLETVGFVGVAAVIAIFALSFLGDSVSWALIFTSLPPSIRWFRRLFFVRLAGEAFNNVVPAGGFAGEPVKAMLLKSRYGIDVTEASASIVMARTVNMVALIGFLLVGLVFTVLSDALSPAIKGAAALGLILLGIGTVLLFAMQRLRVSSWLLRRFSARRWAARLAGALAVAEDLDHRFVTFYTRHPMRLSASLVLAFGNWLLGAVEIYVSFLFFGHPIGWSDAWMIEALIQMVRSAVFFIPLAIGAQDGVMVLIVSAVTGVPPLGLACAALRRMREVTWIALGLIAAAVYPTSLKHGR